MREMRLKKREITDPKILREILESSSRLSVPAWGKRRAEGGCICSGSARGGGDGLQP